MLSRNLTPWKLSVLLSLLPTSFAAVSLIDALYANGASQFAIALLSNQSLLDLYQSSNVKTVFAPIDGYTSNNTGNLRRDQAADNAATLDYQISSKQTQMTGRSLSKKKRAVTLFGDQVVQMELQAQKLVPDNQSIVAEIAVLSSIARVKLRRGAGGYSSSDYSSIDQKPSVPAYSEKSEYSAPPKSPPPDTPYKSSSAWTPATPPESPSEKTYTETKTKELPPPPPNTIKTTTTEVEKPPPPTKDITIVTTATEIIYPPPITKTTLITRTTTEIPAPQTDLLTQIITATEVIQPSPTTRTTVLTITTTEVPPPPVEVITQTFTATEVVLAPPITSTTTATELTVVSQSTTTVATITTTTTELTVISQGTTTVEIVTLTLTSITTLPPVTIPTTTSTTTIATSSASSGVIPNPPIKLASGLGNKVNLLKADIPYDGGLLQITDGYFTVPKPVSQTLSYTNLTSFLSLLNQVNLTSTVDNFHRITIFAPSNAAIANIRSSLTSPAQIQTFVFSHIIEDFLGYLPNLNNVTTLRTLANTSIAVSRQDYIYILNGARIIYSDILTDNGVIQEINQTLTTALAQFPGSAAPTQKSIPLMMAAALVILVSWVY